MPSCISRHDGIQYVLEVRFVLTAEQLLRQGIDLLRDNDRLSALASFEKAYSIEQTPQIQSYLARCIAMERGQFQEALRLCQEAINRETHNPVHYLNMGYVYLNEKRTDEALRSFRMGLSVGDSDEIRNLLEKIGTRRKPVFSFLSRRNILNRVTGLVLERMR